MHELNYHTHELELEFVIHDLKIWRRYLYGKKCKLYTTHKILQYLFSRKDLNMRQILWLELFKDYVCKIAYHPGVSNIITHALSRKEIEEIRCMKALRN